MFASLIIGFCQRKKTSMVEVSHRRSLYSDKTISLLLELTTDEPQTILAVGCGTEDLARRLVSGVQRVDGCG